MRKKLFISILLLIVLISGILLLFIKTRDDNAKKPKKDHYSSKSVVVYFSATGTTETIAKKIANESHSDIIEIEPKEKYTKDDLNYNSDCRANKEQNDASSRPEISNDIDVSKYDVIYLGYPIWWGSFPKIILTFIDDNGLTNKTIIPFCTSGSTDISGSVEDLRKYNSNLNILDGKRFSANSSDEDIKEFVNKVEEKTEVSTLKINIDEKEYTINLENNDTVNKLLELLPLNVTMSELNDNEKYVYLDHKLPTNSYSPKTIKAGDVMLYGDNCLVIFYKTFNTSYSYTKIGHIDNLGSLNPDEVSVSIIK